MNTQKVLIGIVGSYRKEGIIDTAINEIFSEAQKAGVETKKIYLIDEHIEFCTNCRSCMQTPGKERGKCVLEDGMNNILSEIENADYLVIGAPVNFNNINALSRKFMERCAGFAYWPWGSAMPVIRNKKPTKKALLISSSAAPGWMGKYLTGAHAAIKMLAKIFSAKSVGTLWIGKVNEEHMRLPEKSRIKARMLARKLVA